MSEIGFLIYGLVCLFIGWFIGSSEKKDSKDIKKRLK